ncbi:hypothetical protein HPP92_000820 [Vanilla planifolia]|uniref:4-coumarate--CoA ligase n=1 Tax=Vanilla planifolia TaxID=51239 RepID=A0A835SBH1_VANPL|nr:hypothetical protein HPP92_000820 [Vanilla planifolia]
MAYSQGHICHYLRRLLHLRRDCPLTISGDRRRTCGEFVNGVLTLAFGLFVSGLLRTGEVVAIVALNSDLYVEWMLAVTYVGGIVAPFNYRWSLEEAKSAMEVVKPVILVVDESCSPWDLPLDNILNLKSHIRLWTYIGDVEKMESIRKPLQGAQFDPICAADGVALICFTSGTTGQPKGVAISHNALVVQSLAKIAFVGYGEDDVYLHAAPLCHIGGISSCIATLMAGGCHVFVPKFDAELVSDTIEKQHVTALITVPAMMADLISFARSPCGSTEDCLTNKFLLILSLFLLLDNLKKAWPWQKIL